MSNRNSMAWWVRQQLRYDKVIIAIYYGTPNFNSHYRKIEVLERAGYIYQDGDIRQESVDGDKGKLLGEKWTLNKSGARWILDNWGWDE